MLNNADGAAHKSPTHLARLRELECERCDALPENALAKLTTFAELIMEWGSVHNIVSRKYKISDVWNEIFDVLLCRCEVKKILQQASDDDAILDAGSGAGFPGIPLAIIFPHRNFYLVDSDRKKCSFLRMAKCRLDLSNLVVTNKRLEDVEPQPIVCTKAAFSPSIAGQLLAAVAGSGRLLLWATPDLSFAFEESLNKHEASLVEMFDYALPSGRMRRLMTFAPSAFSRST